MLHCFWMENTDIYCRGFLLSGKLMSDQRYRSCCTLSDGKHDNNNTSNTKPIEELNTKCEWIYTWSRNVRASPVRRSDFLLLTWVASIIYLVFNCFFLGDDNRNKKCLAPGTCIITVCGRMYRNQTPTINGRRYPSVDGYSYRQSKKQKRNKRTN